MTQLGLDDANDTRPPGSMRCSVIVPTYEQPALLTCTLDALTTQTLAPDEYEIIVCDDGASDVTRSVVEQCGRAAAISIRYVVGPTPKQGAAAMRNIGWKAARGETIAFTEDDTVPDPDWLRQGLLALEDDDADAASGRVVVPSPDEPTHDPRDTPRLERAGFVTTNCFCRRWVLDSVGGFDTRLRTRRPENSDLFFKLLEAGFDVVHATDAVVVRPVSESRAAMESRVVAARGFAAWFGSAVALIMREVLTRSLHGRRLDGRRSRSRVS